MTNPGDLLDVYVEVGQKRVVAGVLDWPGWCRAGRDEAAALQALVDHGRRYAAVVRTVGLDPRPVAAVAGLRVVERLPGNATTDFGAPGVIPAADRQPADPDAVDRLQRLLEAGWRALDAAVAAAAGKELRTGPRGGGRDLAAIVEHVIGADQGYLARLPLRYRPAAGDEPATRHQAIQRVMLDGLAAAARGELPDQGPRGGRVWPPRFFTRYVAWHVLDHVWEIEDRRLDGG